MDNKSIAGILFETADLLEIDGGDSFRIRSYRNAAEAIEGFPQQISELIAEPKKVLAIPGIGKGMLENLQEMMSQGRLALHAELLKKYRPSMLQLLKVQGLGPKTIALFEKEISAARTVVWNGPLGMFEKPAFAKGTLAIARAVAAATSKGATTIIGGGDSVAAAEQAGVASQISHISTGGGASLEFLAGDKLPGVEALTDAR